MIFANSTNIKSKDAVLFLKQNGFENIANILTGIVYRERNKGNIKKQTSGII